MSFPKKIRSNLTRSKSSVHGGKDKSSSSSNKVKKRQRPKSTVHYSSDEGCECDDNFEEGTVTTTARNVVKIVKSQSFKSIHDRNHHRLLKRRIMERGDSNDKHDKHEKHDKNGHPPYERRRKRSNTIDVLLEFQYTVCLLILCLRMFLRSILQFFTSNFFSRKLLSYTIKKVRSLESP